MSKRNKIIKLEININIIRRIKMAQVFEQKLTIKFSRMVKNNNKNSVVLDNVTLTTLIESIPELCDQIVSDPAVVVEIDLE